MKFCLTALTRALPALLLVLLAAARPTPAGAQELAVAKSDLDAAACRSFRDGAAQPIDEGLLWQTLGLATSAPNHPWSAGEKPGDRKTTPFGYLLVLKKPVAIGSIFLRATSGKSFVLKAGAKVPAEPKAGADWLPVAVPSSQSGGFTAPLAAGQTTQAIWLVDERTEDRSQVEAIRLFKARWQNVVPAALAYASREYYRPPADFQTPFLYAAEHVTRGTETWFSSGKGKDGRVNTPPISDVTPEWFLLAWDEPHTVRSLWIHGNVRNWSLEQFVGPAAINPRAATPREWRKLKDFQEPPGPGRWIVLDKPLETRGLRLNITKVDGQAQIAWIDGFHVLEDLRERPARDLARSANGERRPPFAIPLESGPRRQPDAGGRRCDGPPGDESGCPRAGQERQAGDSLGPEGRARGLRRAGQVHLEGDHLPHAAAAVRIHRLSQCLGERAREPAVAHRGQWAGGLAGRPLHQQCRLARWAIGCSWLPTWPRAASP